MKLTNVVSQKKNRVLGIRLSDAEFNQMNAFAEATGIHLAEMMRRLMFAAEKCFEENDGWPREIAVVKKPRDGANVQPVANSSTYGTQADKTTCSLPPKNANAEPETATKRKPRPQHA